MQYPAWRRIRSFLFALTAPLGSFAILACDNTGGGSLDTPLDPQLDYANGGEPELASCYDQTPGEKWTASVTSAGGTFSMGPHTVVLPANAVSGSGQIYLRELASTSMQMRFNSSQTINGTVEVILSTQDCDIQATQTVWLYDEVSQEFDDVVNSDPDTGNQTMRFWTIQPGAYALAN